MHNMYFLWIAITFMFLCLSNSLHTAPYPEITASPELHRRDDKNQLIGYLEVQGSCQLNSKLYEACSWFLMQCVDAPTYCPEGYTWSAVGSYALCCPTSALNCGIYTACSNLKVYDIFGENPYSWYVFLMIFRLSCLIKRCQKFHRLSMPNWHYI
jgi:hypothetical protein